MNKKLANIIFDAVQYREASYDEDKNTYGTELEEACDRAAKLNDEPKVGRLVYLALYSWWNDTIDWATNNKD